MTLFGLAALFAALALLWPGLRRSWLWLALLYAFVGVDLLILRYYVTSVEPQRLLVHHILL